MLNFNNSKKINLFCSYLICLIPLFLITGPALPDLSITFTSLLFIYVIIREKKFEYFNIYLVNIFFIWCLYFIIRSLFASDILLSLENSLFHFRFGVLVLALIFLFKNIDNLITRFSYILFFSLILVSTDGIFQFFFGFNFFGFEMPNLHSYTGRISGFFKDELIMGSYLSRLFPLSLGLIIFSFSKFRNFKFLIIFFITIINVSVFISGERSAFLYSFLANTIFLIFFNRYRIQIFLSMFLTALIILTILHYNDNLERRMVSFTKDQLTDLVSQKDYYKQDASKTQLIVNKRFKTKHDNKIKFIPGEYQNFIFKSFSIFNENKLFGIGPKMYRIVCDRQIYNITEYKFLDYRGESFDGYSRDVIGCAGHPHNIYLQLLSETGLIGIFPLISFFIYILYDYIIKLIHNIKRKSHSLDNVNICMLTSVLISIWPLIPTGSFFNNWLGVINFVSLSFFIYFRKLKK